MVNSCKNPKITKTCYLCAKIKEIQRSMTNLISKLGNWLTSTTDGRILGLFRIAFGLFMTYYCLYYHQVRFIKEGLLAPITLFKYDGFGWVGLFPEPVLQGILLCMGIAGLLITIGYWMKPAAVCYGVALSYFTLLEKAYYNNHIYLFILFCFLLACTHADRFLSLRGNGGIGPKIPRWQPFLLQFQIAIVYFYGGLAKLAPDWLLHQQPARTMITKYMGYDSEWMVYVINYGGLVLDLTAPFILLYKPFRKWGIIPLIVFHIANSRIFNDIGIFPYVMLASFILFFEAEELPWWRKQHTENSPAPKQSKGQRTTKDHTKNVETPAVVASPSPSPALKWGLITYFIFQLLFPFRGFFLPNALDYTTIGNRFSWRMKIDTRDPEEVSWFARRAETGEERQIKVETYLNPMQIQLLMMDPRAAVDFAHKLRDIAVKGGAPAPAIKAKIKIRYNGRPPQYFIDPETDLAATSYSAFNKLDWVLPL